MSGQDLLMYLKIVRKRLWVVALLVAVTMGTIMAVFLTSKPAYSASVRFLVTAPPSGAVSLYGGVREPTKREEIAWTRANFIEVLRSGVVAWQTVEALGLDAQGSELLKGLEIVESESSDFVRLTVKADTAEAAQMLANGLVETSIDYYGNLQAQPATNSLDFISNQLAEAQHEWEAAEQKLLQFQVENQMGDLDSEILSSQALIRSLRLERDQAEAEGDMAKATAFDNLIAYRQMELQNLLQLSAEYATLRSAVQRSKALYDLLLDKQTEAELKENEARNADFVHIVEPAGKPRRPDSPFNAKILIVGTVASLIVGVLLALVLEYVERLRMFVPPDELPTEVSGGNSLVDGFW